MYYAADSFEKAGYARTILAFGNVSIWWVGFLCVVFLLYVYLKHHAYETLIPANGRRKASIWTFKNHWDIRPCLLIICFMAQYFPWMLVPRGTYIYHYFPSLPFMMLSMVLTAEYLEEAFVKLWTNKGKDGKRADRLMCIGLVLYIALTAVFFLLFFPHASGMETPIWFLDKMNWFSKAFGGWLYY